MKELTVKLVGKDIEIVLPIQVFNNMTAEDLKRLGVHRV